MVKLTQSKKIIKVMNIMKKYIITAAVFLIFVLTAALLTLRVQSPGEAQMGTDLKSAQNLPAKENPQKKAPPKSSSDDASPGAAPADTKARRVTKYILKCNNNKVYLICEYSSGETAQKELSAVKPRYLTDIDRARLESGIELYSAEEVYKLLEDYSS